MIKFLIYLECLVIFTIYSLVKPIIDKLNFIGKSCEWYSSRNIHAWEGRKALDLYNKELEESLKKTYKDTIK